MGGQHQMNPTWTGGWSVEKVLACFLWTSVKQPTKTACPITLVLGPIFQLSFGRLTPWQWAHWVNSFVFLECSCLVDLVYRHIMSWWGRKWRTTTYHLVCIPPLTIIGTLDKSLHLSKVLNNIRSDCASAIYWLEAFLSLLTTVCETGIVLF